MEEPQKKDEDLDNVDALSAPVDNSDNTAQTEAAIEDAKESESKEKKKKKDSPIRRLWDALNIYLLIFGLLVIVAVGVFAVSYLNSRKAPNTPATALQDLTQEQLAQIASGDAQVGDPRYVLNVQSDAVFAGNGLFRGDLNVAGSLQVGKPLSVSSITVSGTSNLTNIQSETLSVTNSLTVQGKVTIQSSAIIRDDLTVGSNARVEGTLSASKVSTNNLELLGNATLSLGGHLSSGGPTPSRDNGNALGTGGTSSVSGNDTAGTVNINTGVSTTAGCFVNIIFGSAYPSTPAVLVTPIGEAAALLDYYVNRSSTGFSICTANAAPNSRSFAFDYFIIG